MRNVKSGFAKIRQQIKKGKVDTNIELLNELQSDFEQKIINLHKTIETKGKENCNIVDRYLEVVEAQGSTSRLTINTQTGRFTLKIPSKSSDAVRKELIEFVDNIKNNDYTLPPRTLRGKIYFNRNENCYMWQGVSESKKFKHTVKGEKHYE